LTNINVGISVSNVT